MLWAEIIANVVFAIELIGVFLFVVWLLGKGEK